MSNPSFIPKRERSPTPPLTLAPRTSGVKLIAPLPVSCKRSSPNCQQARKHWVTSEIKALSALGLTVKKMFIRDDGLSLEWESPIPVFPDTLAPANLPSSLSASPVLIEDDVNMQEAAVTDTVVEETELEKQATELEDLAIEFLKKFVRTFDTDRAALSDAYAHNALFSYCVHEHTTVPRNSVAAAFTNPSAAVHRFAPRKGSRNLRQEKTAGNIYSGPLEIGRALLSLGPHKFCARSPTDLRWNVLALQIGSGSRSKPFVYLSSHGDLTEQRASGEKRLSFDQCFLLQRGSGNGRGSNDANWPLVAVNHQLTVRDLSLRPLAL